MSYSLRAIDSLDLAQILDLNNAAVPAVNELDSAGLEALVAAAALAHVVTSDAAPHVVLGFAIVFAPDADYASENYRWFSARSRSFLYVDRIVVSAEARNQRLGALLYDAIFTAARESAAAEVFCEVNTSPPNPGSLAFHSRLGFTEIGQQATKNGTVVVALLSASGDERSLERSRP
ncbi:GNAT family N-acetyltransferase [Cryobacterium sp. MLB-32]|uniref:GNAT family N-acetyltransferase n=1 Tax=Cryobacterium sp. MLB-32 TaxID=1529318 RepID=UPI00068EBEE0|nr:GNAT family N-acetyltransferase [Cryobacterium sp. MLB-32]